MTGPVPPSPSGNDFHFAELLVAFRPYLLRIADEAIGSDLAGTDSPSDVVQDTLLAAHRDRVRFVGTRAEELRAWLRAILRGRIALLRRACHASAAGRLNHRVSLEGVEIPARTSAPPEDVQRQEEVAAMTDLLGNLSEQQRAILLRRVKEGETFAEIGRRLGMTPGAVRMAWVRALKQLRGWLDLAGVAARCGRGGRLDRGSDEGWHANR